MRRKIGIEPQFRVSDKYWLSLLIVCTRQFSSWFSFINDNFSLIISCTKPTSVPCKIPHTHIFIIRLLAFQMHSVIDDIHITVKFNCPMVGKVVVRNCHRGLTAEGSALPLKRGYLWNSTLLYASLSAFLEKENWFRLRNCSIRTRIANFNLH